jgi:hypothetical protein
LWKYVRPITTNGELVVILHFVATKCGCSNKICCNRWEWCGVEGTAGWDGACPLGVGSGGGVEEKERGGGSGRAAASGSSSPSSPTEKQQEEFFCQDLLGYREGEAMQIFSLGRFGLKKREKRGRLGS